MYRLSFVVMCSLVGCGGGSDDASSLTCSTVPSCYTEAVAALRACVPAPTLALNTVAPMSGTVNGLRCTGGDLTVAFSTFSASPTGTVPLPSTVTLTTAGAFCGELESSSGTRTDNTGASKSFEATSIRVGSNEAVEIATYDDGSVGITCPGAPSESEVIAAPGMLDSCADAVAVHQVVRNADYSQMTVDLIGTTDTPTTLFTCD